MNSVVLDASAVLAVLRDERGADVVAPVLNGALLSAVNYSEVLKKTVEAGGDLHIARLHLMQCEVRVVPFDADLAIETAALYPRTANRGFSMADRACLALGIQRGTLVMTAEQKFAGLELPLEVRVIRARVPN